MMDAHQDVRQTLEYRTDASLIRDLPYGLLLCLFGLFVLTLDDEPPAGIIGAAAVIVAAGLGLIAVALARCFRPGRPLFVLSPAGLRYRMSRTRAMLIPWREIKGVDIVDITYRRWVLQGPSWATVRNVTVVLLSKEYYDTHILIRSWLRRGPVWNFVFQQKGPLVQMALHPDIVSERSQVLREAIEARWQAFRDRPGASGSLGQGASVESVPGAVVVGARPKAWSAWDAAKAIVPLIAIAVVLANLLGLWATAGQVKARGERKAYADWKKAWQQDQDKLEQENKEREKRLQELFKF